MAPSALPQFADWCFQNSLIWSEIGQGRKVNRKRGAWRRPQLTGAVSRLERQLLDYYDFIEHAIVLLLAGEEASAEQQDSVDDDLMIAALFHHGLSTEDASRSLDRTVLSAILLILARWREKQLSLAGAAVQATFLESQAALLKRLKRENAAVAGSSGLLIAQVNRIYQDDAQRFYGDLLDPSPRSRGVREIVEGSQSLGEAVVALRSLFDTEQYRLSMFAEHLTWDAWMAGFRSAAVAATNAALIAGEAPPEFRWAGPQDSKTCQPCLDQFGVPIIARTLEDLPIPSSICAYGRNCRHWFVVD